MGTRNAKIRSRLDRALARILSAGGYQVIHGGYYSPVPELAALPESTWSEPAPMPGVELDLDRQLELIAAELAPRIAEFDPPRSPPGNEEGFYLANPSFGPVDAELLYAIVRRLRPSRALELGSGMSTMVLARAGARNAGDGAPIAHRVVDPFPAAMLEPLRPRLDLRQIPATEVEDGEFEALGENDLLFIDTTHTVKPGSEVNRLVLEVLPELRPGVLVHLHDFFRPFEYPKELYERFGVYWQEQYLVQALLASNPGFEIVLANHALVRLRERRMAELIPSIVPGIQPSSLWLRKL